MPTLAEPTFHFEGCTLDLRRGSLLRGDRDVELRPKSFELLRYLVKNAGRLVSKDELIARLWPNVTVTDESLTRCVSDVRIALDDHAQRMIKTVPRRGYMFAAAVSARATIAEPPGQVPPPLSLVALPFVNLGGESQDHFVDGLTDTLTPDLSHILDASVISRDTACAFRGKQADARQIGRELGVRYVIEGSVQSAADKIRINVQLIDADTRTHLWAQRFDKPRTDPLMMQDEISSLGVRFTSRSSIRRVSVWGETLEVRQMRWISRCVAGR